MTYSDKGRFISCDRCDGKGMRSVWSFGVKEPDECPDCGGSGRNWLYPQGAVARYYGGPLIDRLPLSVVRALDAKERV